MTLNEFKAWLDGFADAMGDAPTPEQWAKIKAKLAQVRDPVDVSKHLYPQGVRTWLSSDKSDPFRPVGPEIRYGGAGWPLPEPNMCATSLGDAIKAAPNMGEWEAKQ